MQGTEALKKWRQPGPMNENEVIIEIGAEGGSIALYGIRTERCWVFSRKVIDQTSELIDEEWIQHNSAAVDTWEAALKLLDQYPWFKLYPIRIHPEFRQKIWLAVQEQLQNDTEASKFALRRWRELCEGLVQLAKVPSAAKHGLHQSPYA